MRLAVQSAMFASLLHRPATLLREVVSLLTISLAGGLVLVGGAVLVLAAGQLALLLGFWIALPMVTPGEVARAALPGGGSAWIRMGRGDPAATTLYVARPGSPTARYALAPLAGLDRPRLEVDAGRSLLTLRLGDATLGMLNWRTATFFEPGVRRRHRPDGLSDAWGRPITEPGSAAFMAYWRAPAHQAARAIHEGLGALGDLPLALTVREPDRADLAAGEVLVVIELDLLPFAMPGALEQARLPARGAFKGPEVWRVSARDLAAHSNGLTVLQEGVRHERTAPQPRSERAVSPTL